MSEREKACLYKVDLKHFKIPELAKREWVVAAQKDEIKNGSKRKD